MLNLRQGQTQTHQFFLILQKHADLGLWYVWFSEKCACVYRVTASGLDTGSRQYISSGHRGSDQAMSEPQRLTALPLNPAQEILKWTSGSSCCDGEQRDFYLTQTLGILYTFNMVYY